MSQISPGNFEGAEFREAEPDVLPVFGTSPLPPAPPTIAGPLGKPPRAVVWPVPIGIIAIVFGVSGALLSLYSAFAPWLMSGMSSWTMHTPNTTTDFDPFAAMRHWAISVAVVHGSGVLIAAMLLWGGIGLLMRRAWSATLLLCWAIIRIPMAFAVTVVATGMQQEQMAAMTAQSGLGGPGGAAAGAFMSGFVWLGAIILIAWYCALPTFMIIWLTRPGVRRDVLLWRVGQSAAFQHDPAMGRPR
jgi:hypothetical protein